MPIDDVKRLARQIDVDVAGDGKGDDERWAHEEIRFHALMNARFEIAVSRQDARADDVMAR